MVVLLFPKPIFPDRNLTVFFFNSWSSVHPAAPYTGPADALWKICASSSAPDIVKVAELIVAGIDLKYTVSKVSGRTREYARRGRVRRFCSLLSVVIVHVILSPLFYQPAFVHFFTRISNDLISFSFLPSCRSSSRISLPSLGPPYLRINHRTRTDEPHSRRPPRRDTLQSFC